MALVDYSSDESDDAAGEMVTESSDRGKINASSNPAVLSASLSHPPSGTSASSSATSSSSNTSISDSLIVGSSSCESRKRRRVEDEGESVVDEGVEGSVAEPTAGSKTSKRLLGSRYAAHALFYRQTQSGESDTSSASVTMVDKAASSALSSNASGTGSSSSSASSSLSAMAPSAATASVVSSSPEEQMRLYQQQMQQQWLTIMRQQQQIQQLGGGGAGMHMMMMPPMLMGGGFPANMMMPMMPSQAPFFNSAAAMSGSEASASAAYDSTPMTHNAQGDYGEGAAEGVDEEEKEEEEEEEETGKGRRGGGGFISIKGADLRPTNFRPDVGSEAAGYKLARSSLLETKVWDAKEGAIISTAEASKTQKRKGQINHLASQARAATLAASVTQASSGGSSKRNAKSGSQYGW